ncbi:unnamed protein product [Prorocentrum cordatum]|uniref:Uncharacterized protein n=1 Tax=Prorocentrum cordatum TaxID=2364126 RepID=A0ABN9X9R8_9DINO|nr:unnamed protein product [Polarella glacialis]
MRGRAVALLAGAAAPGLVGGYRSAAAAGGALDGAGEAAAGGRAACSGHTETTRPVHVLYTRTGLSCANAVSSLAPSTWSPFQASVSMDDPLLTTAGANESLRLAPEVERGLRELNLTLDAVLASSLGRAVQTALLQFGGREVWSVPFAVGKSAYGAGGPHFGERVAQIEAELQGGGFGVHTRANEQWLKVFGIHQGGPADFERFLEKSFLPSLEQTVGADKPPGDPLVLAVVTHGNFLKKVQGCKALYSSGSKGSKVSRLNQVVRKVYRLTTSTPAPDCVDATPKYQLDPNPHVCYPFPAAASRFYEEDGSMVEHCRRDLGQTCLGIVQSEGLALNLVEDQMEHVHKAMVAKNELIIQQNLAVAEQQKKYDEWDHAKDGGAWWNPAGATKETVLQSLRRKQERLARSKEQLGALGDRLAAHQARACLDGGPPQPAYDLIRVAAPWLHTSNLEHQCRASFSTPMRGRAVALLAGAAAPGLVGGYRSAAAAGGALDGAGEAAAGGRAACSGHTETTRPVHVLYTRTGLSCANAVSSLAPSTWSPFQASVSMDDPLLTTAGANESLRLAPEVERGLRELNLTLDAVLASSLGRAVQTALLQFGGREVWSVPFAVGKSAYGAGGPHFGERVAQIEAELQGGGFGVHTRANEQWLKVFGIHQGGPADFERFLEKSFLPSLEQTVGADKPPGDPLVLAVVTHGNFLKKVQGCKALYSSGSKGSKVSRLNQVVRKVYRLTTSTPAPDCVDATPKYQLDPNPHVCYPFPAAASRFYEEDGSMVEHCRRDLGQTCLGIVQSEGLALNLVEDQMEHVHKAMVAKNELIIQQNLAVAEQQKKYDEWDHAKDGGAWWNPAGATKETVLQSLRRKQERLARSKEQLGALGDRLAAHQARACLDGGPPQPAYD